MVRRRAGLLLAVVLAMLVACTGVVLAQTTTPDQSTTNPSSSSSSQPPTEGKGRPIPGQYIVVLKDDKGQDPEQVASDQAKEHGLSVRHVYRSALKGYAAKVPEGRLAALRNDPRVDYVEQDQEMKAVTQTLPWGIDKIDADLSQTVYGTQGYKGPDPAAPVTQAKAYIIDTGIDTTHPKQDGTTNQGNTDLNVENPAAYNALGDGKDWDCAGHGTHVAGTVGAIDNADYVVGAAPSIPLVGVKVLDCSGSGLTSGVIAGVDWVTTHAQKPATANMSLGGGTSTALDTAVKNSAASGIFYSIAAGNSSADACKSSPARAGQGDNGIMTTGALDSSDKAASFSNFGSCVDVWAPGVSILSTKMGGGTTTMSGTSMAAPHVGGTAALYLSGHQSITNMTSVEKTLKTDSLSTGTKSHGLAIKRINAAKY